METGAGIDLDQHSSYVNGERNHKPKIIVIMGPTGSGKSRLAIDLAAHFPIEIINADSMQVYKGLDVLTNKVTLSEQKGVEHHLLGVISPDVEFTCKDFRDSAAPLINDIIARDRLPVIVGGTNFYIQALVSRFLLDDQADYINEDSISYSPERDWPNSECNAGNGCHYYTFERLKSIDPLAANRIHPNDHRKIKRYVYSYERFGIPPSKLFRGESAEYVDQRVDRMIDSGLLEEVCDVHILNADYTRGIRQAIGVREFEEFLNVYCEVEMKANRLEEKPAPTMESQCSLKERLRGFLESSSLDDPERRLLEEGISKLKMNTRRLVRRQTGPESRWRLIDLENGVVQKRRVSRLQMLFGWNIHRVDSTETLLGASDDSWIAQVVEPSVDIIRSFLNDETVSSLNLDKRESSTGTNPIQRDLWTQYVCDACGNRVLRGDHEWDQHRQGRGHRKRVARLRKVTHHGSESTQMAQSQE